MADKQIALEFQPRWPGDLDSIAEKRFENLKIKLNADKEIYEEYENRIS